MNPDPTPAVTFRSGITLHTKDGGRIGNGHLYRVEVRLGLTELYCVETDFGNRAKFSRSELETLYRPGFCVPYEEWAADKRERAQRNQTMEAENGN